MIKHIYKYINPSLIHCFTIEYTYELSSKELSIIFQLIDVKESFKNFSYQDYIEYGPYLTMVSPWASNALHILEKCRLNSVTRIELSKLVHKNLFNRKMVDSMTQQIYNKPIETFIINETKNVFDNFYEVKNIEDENEKHKLGFDKQDLKFYHEVFQKLDRNPTNVELHDLAQSNSEHSRHWFFNGKFIDENGYIHDESLMKKIKRTLSSLEKNLNEKNSVIAFSDNSSSIVGNKINYLKPNILDNCYAMNNLHQYNPVFTAETHNFPTSIAPFPGAATGTGGRIRDNHSIGRGGLCLSGITGYSIGSITNGKYIVKNVETLIGASNGASDYGNKFGEPVIQGFCRSYGQTFLKNEYGKKNDCERIEYVKPIMFSAGIGQMNNVHTLKETHLTTDILVVRIGGPAYKIGIGGGAASSRDQKTENLGIDLSAVQRGDPEMENKLNRVIRACIELEEHNPILSIHDQGAGGMANVTKEIVCPNGAKINLKNVKLGDQSMSVLEIWISEHQEQDTILVKKDNIRLLVDICERENIDMSIIGQIDNSGKITVEYITDGVGKKVVEFDLEQILGKHIPHKFYHLVKKTPYLQENSLIKTSTITRQDFNKKLSKVLQHVSVCSKRFLTNKVDRSVTGLIAQQQCCGSLQTPLVDYSVTAQSYFDYYGIVTAVGERPINGLINVEAMVRMSVGEMLTNIMFCKIDSLHKIRCSGNWMWPLKMEGEKERLYKAVCTMCSIMENIGIALDGGKDSLSMVYQDDKEVIKSPGTLVISGYTTTTDFRKKVTPDFKNAGNHVYYINLSNNRYRLGSSILNQTQEYLGLDEGCPDFEDTETFKSVFHNVQQLIENNIIISGHDVSDGGLITSLLEMCFAGNLGLTGEIVINQRTNYENFLFAEELGIIIEVHPQHQKLIEETFYKNCYYHIGTLLSEDVFNLKINTFVINNRVSYLRSLWEKTSWKLELEQTNHSCANMEYDQYSKWVSKFNFEIYNSYIKERLLLLDYSLDYSLDDSLDHSLDYLLDNSLDNSLDMLVENTKPKVAIIREEGSNGDREMAAAFYEAGFNVYDLCMNDFINGSVNGLEKFRGIVFVGGFSYSDVFGAGRGWYQIISSNTKIKREFDKFYEREDTFSLGICNGCQLMSLLGWIPKCKLVENNSGRFESRFSRVKINKNKAMMLNNMDESVLGIWTAHGEGKFVINESISHNLIALQYVDNRNEPTMLYPQNPNGSDLGIAGLCSQNGRHLAMMPHPERCYLNWQKPIRLTEDKKRERYNAWFLMFKNAYEWCLEK